MAQEWRVIQRTRGSTLKQLWVRLRSGLWAPTERFMCDAQVMPPIMGGSPDVVNRQVGASADDGHTTSDGLFYNANNTSIYGQYNSTYQRDAFYRWIGISGLGGATIGVAHMSLYDNAVIGTPESKVYAEDAAAPTQIASRSDYVSRTPTSASVPWDGALTGGGWHNSPSIVPVIQELADSYDPTVIQILHKNDMVGETRAEQWVYNWDYDDNTYGPKLHIEYTAGGAAYYHGLKVQGEAAELALCDVGINPLRFRKGGTTYGIELVATDDPNASRIRIKTPTGIKAIRKYT